MTEERKLPLVMNPPTITYEPFGQESVNDHIPDTIGDAINSIATEYEIGILVIAPGEYKKLQELAREADMSSGLWLAKAMNMLANHQRFPPNPPIGESDE